MSDRARMRLFVLQVLVISLLATLFGRLWYLQVIAGGEYAEAATQNRQREVITDAPRGMILDDLGRPLVRNRTSLVISVDRTELADQPDGGEAVLRRLSGVIGMAYGELHARVRFCDGENGPPCWNGSPYQPIPVAEGVDPKAALRIEEHQARFPGVTAEFATVREYPFGEQKLAAHTLGHLAPVSAEDLEAHAGDERYRPNDLIGRVGLEATYDSALRGRDGVRTIAVDHVGNVVGVLGETPPEPGNSVVLSLDADIQRVAQRALTKHIKLTRQRIDDRNTGVPFRADSGAVVVLEARTGRVVALASQPTYNPSVWVNGIGHEQYAALTGEESGHPLVSRATQGVYAPASTWKPFMLAAAVATGDTPLHGTYDCPSSVTIGNRRFDNFGHIDMGRMSLHTAIVRSCDTIFYELGAQGWLRSGGYDEDASEPPMQRTAWGFGFGGRTGIDLPSESEGRIVGREYERRYWEEHKDELCRRAETGYPEVAKTDPEWADYLHAIAKENCTDGWRYTPGDAANFAIGQGDTAVTPLQLAVGYAAIANGGTLFEPRLAKAIVDESGVVRRIEPPVAGRVPVSDTVLRYLREALADVPRVGTAEGAFAGFPLDRIPVAGKTGTGQVAGKQDTAWFASYAPVDDPRYVVVGMISQGGQGGVAAAPMVRDVYEGIYGIGQPAALPCGAQPHGLPRLRPDGTVRGACEAPAP